MRIERDKYLNDLVIHMGNGAIKVVTGIRLCGKTHLVFNLFREHLRNAGVPDDYVIEVALDADENARLRDAHSLGKYLVSRSFRASWHTRASRGHGASSAYGRKTSVAPVVGDAVP